MSVCLSICKLFFPSKISQQLLRILKFGTKLDGDELYCVTKEQPHFAYQSLYLLKLDSDELYCVTKEQPHIAYQSLYLFIFLSLQWKFLSQISQLLLGPAFSNLVYIFRKAKCTVYMEIKMLMLILPSFFKFSFFPSDSLRTFFLSKIFQQPLELGF